MSTRPRIAVVDHGAGNLRSVAKALLRSGLAPEVTADPGVVRAAQAVVLPGVGAFAEAVANLRNKGLADAVLASIEAGRPHLGICLGLQVLFDESDEHGRSEGLGWLPGRVERFADVDAEGRPLRVPHIGWNRVVFDESHPMCARLPREDCFYFVHSYRAVPAQAPISVGHADYGGGFTAAVARDNVFAVQFHPEKSQSAGKRLLDAFSAWIASCA
jgi:glutamine amidotransferase